MSPILRNILAVIAGLLFGSLVNGGIVLISDSVIAPPNGADVTTIEGLKASLHLFEPKHFLMPFLAHAIGTFSAAFLAAKMAASHQMKISLGIGTLFMAAGIANILMLPSPLWFSIVDIAGAYLPMAYLAYKLADSKKS